VNDLQGAAAQGALRFLGNLVGKNHWRQMVKPAQKLEYQKTHRTPPAKNDDFTNTHRTFQSEDVKKNMT
jgi:hypothetical protein